VQRRQRESILVGDVERLPAPLLEHGEYQVRQMTLTRQKLAALWKELLKYRTLFSDLTRGDFVNFVQYVTSEDTLWLEIWRGSSLVGIATFEELHKVIDAESHVLFFDRELANKVPVCKAIIAWLFANFPLQRLSTQLPSIYHAPIRLTMDIGFVREGRKRQAVLISGRWVDVDIFGIVRSEVK